MHKDLKDFVLGKIENILSDVERQKEYVEIYSTDFKKCLDNVFSDIIKPEKNEIEAAKLKSLKPKLNMLAFKTHIYKLLEIDILQLQELINLFKQVLETFKRDDFLNVEIIIQEFKNKKCDYEKLKRPNLSELDNAIKELKEFYKKAKNDPLKEVHKDLIDMHKDIKQMLYTENYAQTLLNEIRYVARNKKPRLKVLELISVYGKKGRVTSKSIIHAECSDINKTPIDLKPNKNNDKESQLFNFFEPLIIHEGEFVGYSRLVENAKTLDEDTIAEEARKLLNELFISFDELLNIYFIHSKAYFEKKSKEINSSINLHNKYELRAYKFKLPEKIFSRKIIEGKISYISQI